MQEKANELVVRVWSYAKRERMVSHLKSVTKMEILSYILYTVCNWEGL